MRKYIFILTLILAHGMCKGQQLDSLASLLNTSNSEVKIANYDQLIAEEKLKLIDKLDDPNFSAGYFISPVETRTGPQQVKLSLSQTLPWFGTFEAKENAANSLIQKARYDKMSTLNKSLYELNTIFLEIHYINSETEIIRKQVENLKSIKVITLKNYSSGLTSMTNVLKLNMEIDRRENVLDLQKNKKAAFYKDLNRLLNTDTIKNLEYEGLAVSNLLTKNNTSTKTNPMLLAEYEQLNYKNYNVENIRKSLKPKIALGIDYIMIGAGTTTSELDGNNAFMPNIAFSIPLYKGKNTSIIQSSELEVKKQQYKIELVEDKLNSDFEKSVLEIENYELNNANLESLIEQNLRIIDLMVKEYENGSITIQELLDEYDNVFKLELEKLNNTIEQQKTINKLNFITGYR